MGALIPQARGGALRNGGTNRGGTGRPPNVIRAGLREKIPAEVAKLEKHVREIEKLAARFDAMHPEPEDAAIVTPADRENEATRCRHRMAMQERVMAARQQLLDYRAKYGLGTTITETDDTGRSVQVDVTRRVVRVLAEGRDGDN